MAYILRPNFGLNIQIISIGEVTSELGNNEMSTYHTYIMNINGRGFNELDFKLQ